MPLPCDEEKNRDFLCPDGGLDRDNGERRSLWDYEWCGSMLEDEWLKLQFKAGSDEVLRRIYQKYRDYLLTLAMGLLNDSHLAEDVLHDVFVTFAQSTNGFGLQGNLKGYLATCVANRAKDRLRGRQRQASRLETDAEVASDRDGPDTRTIATEESRLVSAALGQLPYEQREAVALHLNAGLTFRQIAKHQHISTSTAKGRYRYGLKKLRSTLNGRL
jgi:RNA polymerase sigma-70 factor (ECF subfamily)